MASWCENSKTRTNGACTREDESCPQNLGHVVKMRRFGQNQTSCKRVAAAFLLLELLFFKTSMATNSSCAEALHAFLEKVAPVFDPADKSLTLELMELSDFSAGCRTPFYSVELWRVIQQPGIQLPKDFGSTEYFEKDQHCENPNPDLLSRHGQPRRAWGWQQEWEVREGEQATAEVRFLHVVERQYMLRLCPCQDSGQCTCEYVEPGQRVCSSLIEVDNPGVDQVFPWCRGRSQPTPHPKIDSPVVQHCPAQLRITGLIPSCTEVRSYDRVEVILQAVNGEPEHCRDLPLPALTGSNRLESRVPLTAINTTHGSFDVVMENITHGVHYCLRVELVNHPYCNSGADQSLDRQTKICRPALWNEPIFIADHQCGPLPPCPESRPNLPLITGASLAAALVLAIGLVLLHRVACRRPPVPRDPLGADLKLLAHPPPQSPDVFFLYFHESDEFIAVNRLVSRWLTGLGHVVHDLGDPALQEELVSSPEAWIMDKLEDGKTKVVVVDSSLANQSLSLNSGEVLKDDVSGLRVFSLRQILTQLGTNYRRLAVVQYRHTSHSLPGLVPHTRHLLPDHLPELQAWLAETQGWDDNDNVSSNREQTLRDLKAAVQKYTAVHHTLENV